MAKVTVKFESKRLLSRMQIAWELVNETDLPRAFDYEIGAAKWEWVGETQRRNGSIVTSPRSIVDQGDLADSYDRQKAGKKSYVHSWDVDYAMATHEGAQLKNRGLIYPRPWTEEPREAIPEMFAYRFRAAQ